MDNNNNNMYNNNTHTYNGNSTAHNYYNKQTLSPFDRLDTNTNRIINRFTPIA